MVLDPEETIVALASAPGPAARGIVRISGPSAAAAIRPVFRCGEHPDWASASRARRFEGELRLSSVKVPVPAALMYWPTNRSYTGQPMAELHLTGSPPLLDAVIAELCGQGARLARRGEFTMRAFLAGRIDLLQAEAVLGVIEAADHEELFRALNQMGGGITSQLDSLRTDLIVLLADLEAGLDFVDEDIEFVSRAEVSQRIQESVMVLERLLNDAEQRLPSGSRRTVVLAGLPNAGKSTLFNRLIDEERAIVSPIPGTTRDYVSAVIDQSGCPIELIDTAGWEQAADLIMQKAQELREQQLDSSNLVVWCTAADLSPEELRNDERLRGQILTRTSGLLHVMTCIDRRPNEIGSLPVGDVRVSTVTGEGLSDLKRQLEHRLRNDAAGRGELLGTTAVRCRDSLRRAVRALRAAELSASQGAGDELIAAELRTALRELAVILGEVYTDDLLDQIFSRFCIGK